MRPGKKLLFMGTELAPWDEWNHDVSLDWRLLGDPMRAGFSRFLRELGALYHAQPPLWRDDAEPAGFQWIDVEDRANSVLSWVRRAGEEHVVVALNFTPVPRENYRIGAPQAGTYVELLSSDATRFGGSEVQTLAEVHTEDAPFHGYPQSMRLVLPPLGGVVLGVRGSPWGSP
jgi:1,4-alpha-glucan branching enzyme